MPCGAPTLSCLLTSVREGKIDERFQDQYDKLRDIRDKLEQMNLTQAWSLRETDLYSFQRRLDRIDENRVDGNFLDDQGKPADLHAQRVCLLLQSRTKLIDLLDTVVPAEEKLRVHLPVYNRLRARLRGVATDIQPTPHAQTMSTRGQKGRWHRFAPRVVSI